MAATRLVVGQRPATLRTTEWDGPPPGAGAVVLAAWRVLAVAAGPGLGQYVLDVDPCDPAEARHAPQVIEWRGEL